MKILVEMRKLVLSEKAKMMLVIVLAAPAVIGQNNTIKKVTDLGTRYDYSYSIELQEDGKIVQAGDASGNPCIIRFDTTGFLDHSFGQDGKVFASWDCGSNPADNDIKVQPDGKIVLGTHYFNGSDVDFIVARYHSDGSSDVSFGNNGQVITPIGKFNDRCNAISLLTDGSILASGGTNITPDNSHFALVKYLPDGKIDSTFGYDGVAITHLGSGYNMAYSMAIQQDQKIVVAGEASDSIYSNFALVRYNSDGSLDHEFGDGGIVRTALSPNDDVAKSVVIQPDGKIVVAGSSRSDPSNSDFAIVRYTENGSLDETFGVSGKVITDFGNDYGFDIALQSNGAMILVGSSTSGTLYDFATLRFDSSGTLDTAFGIDGLLISSFGPKDSEGISVCLKEDGEIIVAGYYNHGTSKYFDFATLRLFSSLILGTIDQEVANFSRIAYPNPVSNGTTLNYSLSRDQEVSIVLLDINGRIALNPVIKEMRLAGPNQEFIVFDEAIAEGIYFLEIILENQRKSIKIIKK